MLSTALLPVPLVPEISLHLAGPDVGLFDATGGEFRSDEPPPFWAFVWAGGQALARYVLDHPEQVRRATVLDLAAGSGIAGIAAAKAGAADVRAADVDPAAAAAIRRNAMANGVTVHPGAATQPGVVLAGDAFYSAPVAARMASLLRGHARRGARVLVGDPGRGYFPDHLFRRIAEYVVPVPTILEETDTLITGVYEMRLTKPAGQRQENVFDSQQVVRCKHLIDFGMAADDGADRHRRHEPAGGRTHPVRSPGSPRQGHAQRK